MAGLGCGLGAERGVGIGRIEGGGVGIGELSLGERKKVGRSGLEASVILLSVGGRVGWSGMGLLLGVEKLSDWRVVDRVRWLISPGILTDVYTSYSLSKTGER